VESYKNMPTFGQQELRQGLLSTPTPPENACMREPCQVFQKVQLNPKADPTKGFVLLEVLVAMSLILGSWMALVATYQYLALRAAQEDNKRTQLRKEFDAFEISEQVRANANTPLQGMSNESTRMSSRTRAVHVTSKSTPKNKR